ncbi:hypothetical protein [Fuscovulum ytuae]|uniref:Sulfotransferase family protein n=1 Tax=Fuscovulum ytuae TaxID=3042299 RepID=A0ABY8Q834_9RHOB|nr:hypothetical protein [Fuscovulum sp. YMD61]WGV17030.1 hypothetical protein QF092_04270 [Fuscovulum sp. YMD61]
MRLILHVGMGKTGTSSIQKRLANSTDALRAQRAHYLGMWLDMVDPRVKALNNQTEFFTQDAETIRTAGDILVSHMKQRHAVDGVDTFILSNEALAGKAILLRPMVDRIRELGVSVRVIAYVRNPIDWLPSAFVQWGVRHKLSPGRVRPYPEKARRLVSWYRGILEWHEQSPELLELRSYDDAPDVVADFSAAIGLRLPPSPDRELERAEDAEIILRALFNDAFKATVLPERFNRLVLPNLDKVARLDDVIAACLDYSETPQVVAENAAFFDRVAAVCGFDPRTKGKGTPRPAPDPGPVKDRILDALVEITLMQAQQIRRLEDTVERLARGEDLPPGSFPPIRRP